MQDFVHYEINKDKLVPFENNNIYGNIGVNLDNKWSKMIWKNAYHDNFVSAIRNRNLLEQFTKIGIDIYSSYITAGYLVLQSKNEAIVVYATISDAELKLEYIDFFVENIGNLKTENSILCKLNIYGAIAAISLSNKIKAYAKEKGLFIIENNSNGLPTIKNTIDFKPIVFQSKKNEFCIAK